MKIVLVALNAKYVHSNLAVYDIEAYTRHRWTGEYGSEAGLDLSVREYTINHNLDMIMQSLYHENPSFIAFSCYIWNIFEVLTICRELKKVMPKLSIWLGGPEVSYDSEKVLIDNPYIDGVILGEGEATFYELVRIYSENDTAIIDKTNVKGITYKAVDGSIIKNPMRPLISMDEIPFIYNDLEKFENKILYYESSRGCPFSCSYCLSSIDKRVRFRNLTLVKNELSFFMENKVRQVKFIDRTFNCDKKRAREIWNYLADNDNGVTNYHFEIAADLIEDEDLLIFKKMRPGLIQLEIGLQSTNNKTIKEIRRVMDIDKLKHNMLMIRSMGNIHQHLDLIAGLPYEDYESFVQSFNDAYSMKPNQLQLGFLKVLKGSYMEEQVEEYGLLYRDEQPYEVLATKWISYGEILKLKQIEEMVEVYYNSDQFEHVLPYVETLFATPYEMFESLGGYYEKHELFGMGYKREARYEILREFFSECIGDVSKVLNKPDAARMSIMSNESDTVRVSSVPAEKLRVFDCLLTFDYYLRENAKARPSWSKDFPVEKEAYNNFFKRGGTEEISLMKDGYDSKVAARNMHIEPVTVEAVKWICSEVSGNDSEKTDDNPMYVVYNYDKRDPLSGDAEYTIISHL